MSLLFGLYCSLVRSRIDSMKGFMVCDVVIETSVYVRDIYIDSFVNWILCSLQVT